MEDNTEPVAGAIEEPGIQTSTPMNGGHITSPAYNADHLESALDTNEMNSDSISASGCRTSQPSTADNAGHIVCAVDPEKVPVEKKIVVAGKRATFSCHTCANTFRSEKLFLQHQKNVHNTYTAGAYWCLHCDYSTTNKNSYYQHTLVHVERRFKCEECQKTFKRREHLLNHRVTHTKEKKFRCSTCDRSFSKRYNLVRHERVQHLGVGAVKNACESCGRCFNRADNLARHQTVHTRERPFKCDKCPKGYRHRCNLKKHVEKMHSHAPSP